MTTIKSPDRTEIASKNGQHASTSPTEGDVGPASAVVIEASHVHRVFDTEDGFVHALADVSFKVHEGEMVTLIGASGCGKSTLLNMIAGLDHPSTGELLLSGTEITKSRSAEIGYVFQQSVLLPWRSNLQNVLLPVQLLGLPRRSYVERARELLHLVGLDGFEESYPSELSGGMQQRVAIARALVHEPTVLLMDEPFGALDAITRDRMNVELLRLADATGATILFVTHDLREAAFVSDRVVVMTTRPGSVFVEIDAPFSRPRPDDQARRPEFAQMLQKLGEAIADASSD